MNIIKKPKSEPTLADLKPGTLCQISAVNIDGLLRRRIFDLGLVPGTMVSCVRTSPAGNPIAFAVRGSIIALRLEDANRINISSPFEAAWEA